MVDKVHCPECGFLMMYSIDKEVTYTCINTHEFSGNKKTLS